MTKLANILDQIDAGVMLPPAFRRGHAWNPYQVRGLTRPLHRGYPVGSLLVRETATTRPAGPTSDTSVQLFASPNAVRAHALRLTSDNG